MGLTELVLLIQLIARLFAWIVIASALLSFILPPYHPVREALDRIVDPFLNPIRQILPNTGMMDFSPLVLILAIQAISSILISILQ